MRYIRLFTLLIVFVAALGTVALAREPVGLRQFLGVVYKPHEIPISGDGDTWVQGLRWRTWGGKTAAADGQAIEQVRPSHVNHSYQASVTLGRRAYCANLHRTVYLTVSVRILGPSPGVFGSRTFGQIWTCSGTWQLVSSPASNPGTTPPSGTTPTSGPSAKNCSAHGVRLGVVAINEIGSDCARARTLVGAWFDRLKTPGGQACLWADGSTRPGVCSVGAWRCSAYHTVNGQTYPVVCTRDAGHRRVRFVTQV